MNTFGFSTVSVLIDLVSWASHSEKDFSRFRLSVTQLSPTRVQTSPVRNACVGHEMASCVSAMAGLVPRQVWVNVTGRNCREPAPFLGCVTIFIIRHGFKYLDQELDPSHFKLYRNRPRKDIRSIGSSLKLETWGDEFARRWSTYRHRFLRQKSTHLCPLRALIISRPFLLPCHPTWDRKSPTPAFAGHKI